MRLASAVVTLGLLGPAALAPVSGFAATVAYLTDGQLATASDRIVHGVVLAVRYESAPGGVVHTTARVRVIEDLTGIDDPVVEIRELGGVSGPVSMVVPGSPRFEPGAEILACLESSGDGQAMRLVALGYSLFDVLRPGRADEAVLDRQDEALVVLDRPVLDGGSRTLAEFRRVVTAVRGSVPVRPGGQEADALGDDLGSGQAAGERLVSANYTLLGGGVRWNEVDAGVAITWYRNDAAPAPVQGTSGDEEIRTALSAWSLPPSASIALVYGGARSIGADSPYCGMSNSRAGLISFEDPTNEIGSGVLAIGGGCTTTVGRRTVNGTAFDSFTHGFVVLNNAAQMGPAYQTPLNFARLVQHEVGHGIGIGHTQGSITGAQSNIMYPSCCFSSTPVPPALGADDLAGLEFIYPLAAQVACTFVVAPLSVDASRGEGEARITVSASAPTCSWSATSGAGWITVRQPATITGSGEAILDIAVNPGPSRTGTVAVAGQTVVVTQAAYDTDGDGLPDEWETFYGLDADSAAGSDGAGGDPDGDGLTNARELESGGHPRGFYVYELAEGAAGPLFATDIPVIQAAPSAPPASVVWRTFPRDARCATGIGARVAGDRWFAFTPTMGFPSGCLCEQLEFGSRLESDHALVVERTMAWPVWTSSYCAGGVSLDTYGAHAEGDFPAPSTTWYFAEGATHSAFDLFYLVRNVEARPVLVTATYLRPAPLDPVVKSYRVEANARFTIWVDQEDARLASTDVAAGFSTDGGRVVVERAMYASTAAQVFAAGHVAAGATTPSARWLFAEGATGNYFDAFLLIGNPGPAAADVRVRYLLPDTTTVVRDYRVEPRSRLSVWVDGEDASLRDTAFSVDLSSTNGVPVIAERAMWWPGPTAATWHEAHVSSGATFATTRWVTADGEVGGERNARTYLLLSNPASIAVDVQIRLFFRDSASPTRTFTVGSNARLNVDVAASFPEASGRRFGAEVVVVDPGESIPPLPPTAGIVVERATYWDSRGQPWAAGVNLRATPVPVFRVP